MHHMYEYFQRNDTSPSTHSPNSLSPIRSDSWNTFFKLNQGTIKHSRTSYPRVNHQPNHVAIVSLASDEHCQHLDDSTEIFAALKTLIHRAARRMKSLIALGIIHELFQREPSAAEGKACAHSRASLASFAIYETPLAAPPNALLSPALWDRPSAAACPNSSHGAASKSRIEMLHDERTFPGSFAPADTTSWACSAAVLTARATTTTATALRESLALQG